MVGFDLPARHRRRLAREAVDLGRALFTQALIQALTALSGILIVRALDPREYAYYTIAAAAITAMAALSNGGILEGMSAAGARKPTDPNRLAALVETATSLRTTLALAIGLPIAVSAILMLAWNGAPIGTIIPLVLAVVLVNLGELSWSVLYLVPWLGRRIPELQMVELQGSLARFAACAILPLCAPRADLAVLCAAVGFGVQIHLLRRRRLVPQPTQPVVPDPALRRELVSVLRRQWPNEINTLVQSQIVLWLLTACAGAADVAAFGALGRITIVFGIILQALHRTMLGRYAGLQSRGTALRVYAAVIGAFLLLAAVPLSLFIAFPRPVLHLFGHHYIHLVDEFRLFAIYALLSSLATLTLWLNSTRAWIMPAAFRIAYQSASLLGFVLLFGAGSLSGVLMAGIAVNLMLIAANFAYTLSRLREMAPA
ncbi:MAG TPA: hypothetical protein VKS60_08330 [Stellaceae bacterium]|nr:hypothetical protein [Stellaceae bacterium]